MTCYKLMKRPLSITYQWGNVSMLTYPADHPELPIVILVAEEELTEELRREVDEENDPS